MGKAAMRLNDLLTGFRGLLIVVGTYAMYFLDTFTANISGLTREDLMKSLALTLPVTLKLVLVDVRKKLSQWIGVASVAFLAMAFVVMPPTALASGSHSQSGPTNPTTTQASTSSDGGLKLEDAAKGGAFVIGFVCGAEWIITGIAQNKWRRIPCTPTETAAPVAVDRETHQLRVEFK